jgi:hypothetical protein
MASQFHNRTNHIFSFKHAPSGSCRAVLLLLDCAAGADHFTQAAVGTEIAFISPLAFSGAFSLYSHNWISLAKYAWFGCVVPALE